MTVRYRLREGDLEWVESPFETVILDDASEQYFATNSAGALLWSALAEYRTAGQLGTLLVEKYQIEESRAASDVEAFLTRLSELDLLETDG